MLQQSVSQILARDLGKLKQEVAAYTNESDLWKLAPGISNSAGNLTLHLIGNLNHFIGATLGNTGYIRNRDAEFTLKDVPRQQILDEIDMVTTVINTTLAKLPNEELDKIYPVELGGNKFQTGAFLIHLTGHLNYHLGQINYHRRLLTS